MERVPFEAGRIVRSLQGRDAGRYFIVLAMADEQYVLMADGLTRKLDHPKKKKIKHLRAKPVKFEGLQDRIANKQLLDSDLRKFLNGAGCGIDQPLCKEG